MKLKKSDRISFSLTLFVTILLFSLTPLGDFNYLTRFLIAYFIVYSLNKLFKSIFKNKNDQTR